MKLINSQSVFASSSQYPPPESSYLSSYPTPESIPVYLTPSAIQVENTLPSQSGSSEAAQQAMKYISERYYTPIEVITVYDDHSTEYKSLGREFQVVTLVDSRHDGDLSFRKTVRLPRVQV